MGNEIQLAINQIFPRWKSTEKTKQRKQQALFELPDPQKRSSGHRRETAGIRSQIGRASWLEAQWVETRCVLNHSPEMSYLPLGKAQGRDPTEMVTF